MDGRIETEIRRDESVHFRLFRPNFISTIEECTLHQIEASHRSSWTGI